MGLSTGIPTTPTGVAGDEVSGGEGSAPFDVSSMRLSSSSAAAPAAFSATSASSFSLSVFCENSNASKIAASHCISRR
jgi:hypothetical protein